MRARVCWSGFGTMVLCHCFWCAIVVVKCPTLLVFHTHDAAVRMLRSLWCCLGSGVAVAVDDTGFTLSVDASLYPPPGTPDKAYLLQAQVR